MKKISLFLIALLFSFSFTAQADLYDRLTRSDENDTDKIAVHAFSVALREYARGAITTNQIINAFNLDAGEQAQLNAIGAEYTSKPNAQQKSEYLVKIHDVFILAEAGFYSKLKVKSELGFS